MENDAVESAWLTVYRDPKQYWDLYQLGEELLFPEIWKLRTDL